MPEPVRAILRSKMAFEGARDPANCYLFLVMSSPKCDCSRAREQRRDCGSGPIEDVLVGHVLKDKGERIRDNLKDVIVIVLPGSLHV